MPTITELLRAEGLEISPELEAKLPTLTEASDEVRSVVSVKEELLKWKQDNTDKVSGFDEVQAKLEAELNEREKLAIANKDFEEQIKVRDEREARKDAQIKLNQERTLASTQESNESQIAAMFMDPFQGQLIAKNLAKSSIDDAGEVVTTFNLNGETFSSLDELKGAVSKNESLAKLMSGPQSSGPSGTGGNNGGGSVTPKFNGNKQEKLAANLQANPKLSELPER
ncbi:coil containing protein [Vibrio phage 1.085.O._10N.222.51.E3]|nr:coil containing protein [Vibrio phage 1.085.O._10N.222.51.E3]AUR89872.1 coil containing protein [Vibrio phage 1.134.O._10N.222.52.B8]AUR92707.1 coil containing protein [Vibrio phage 1.176.O._10N.261.55.F5]